MKAKQRINTIHFGRSGTVEYSMTFEDELDTVIDLSNVRFAIAGEDRKKFHEALEKLIEEFHI